MQRAALHWQRFDALLADDQRRNLSKFPGRWTLRAGSPSLPAKRPGSQRMRCPGRPSSASNCRGRHRPTGCASGARRCRCRAPHATPTCRPWRASSVSAAGRFAMRRPRRQSGPLARSPERARHRGRPLCGQPPALQPQAGVPGAEDHPALHLARHRPARRPAGATARDLQHRQVPRHGCTTSGVLTGSWRWARG